VRAERSAARTLPCLAAGAPARGRWEKDGAGELGGYRLQALEKLPKRDQETVLRTIDAFLAKAS
jgi:hypothetical protein